MSEKNLYVGAKVDSAGWDSAVEFPPEAAGYSVVYLGALHRGTEQEALDTLAKAWAALVPGGTLVVSTLDLQRLGNVSTGMFDQVEAIRLIYGCRSLWTETILATYAQAAGFANPRRAQKLDWFSDTSALSNYSLIVLATKPESRSYS